MKHLLLSLLILFLNALPLVQAGKKNVLLLISDNQTWSDTGCYGHPIVKTPNVDALAAEGVRFRQAFATTASCGPSRAVMYTGLLTHSNGMYAHPHREHNQGLRPHVATVFSMLKENGYRTALIGKDHIRPMDQYPIDYLRKGKTKEVGKMANSARAFLAEENDAPFLLVMAYGDPHPNGLDGVAWGVKSNQSYQAIEYDPAEVVVPPFLPDTPDVRQNIAGYYQQISRMDHGVGLVLQALEETGKAEDTLVIFISDHGTSEPAAMGTHYEPGVRVPFVVRKPGATKKGIVSEALVAFTDLTPTILDWTETKFDRYPLHGRSIVPILEEEKPEDWGAALLSHVGHDVFAHYPMRTLRHPRFKLIWNVTWRAEYPIPIDTIQRRTWLEVRENKETMLGLRTVDAYLHRPQLELYDLETDPWEVTNLAEDPAHKEKLDTMVEELVARLDQQRDPWRRKYDPRVSGQ